MGLLRMTDASQLPEGKVFGDDVLALTLLLPHSSDCTGLQNAVKTETPPISASAPGAAAASGAAASPAAAASSKEAAGPSASPANAKPSPQSNRADMKRGEVVRGSFTTVQLYRNFKADFELEACSWSVSHLRRRIKVFDRHSARKASHVMRLLRADNECGTEDSARQIQGCARKLSEAGFGVALHTGDAAAVRAQILAAAKKLFVARVRHPKVCSRAQTNTHPAQPLPLLRKHND